MTAGEGLRSALRPGASLDAPHPFGRWSGAKPADYDRLSFPCSRPWQRRQMGTSTDVVRGRATAPDQRQTIVVEFARLSAEQQAFVDLHTLRAVGTALPAVDT